MATIKKRGESYLIRVNDGASKGKRRRPSKVWTPEEGIYIRLDGQQRFVKQEFHR